MWFILAKGFNAERVVKDWRGEILFFETKEGCEAKIRHLELMLAPTTKVVYIPQLWEK